MTDSAGRFDQWIKCFHPGPDSGMQLICLPYAGGSASGWFRLSAALPPSIQVWAAQYPGRQERRRERPIEDVRELAAALVDVVRDRLDGPYALLGHSMGALVAFEMARLLESGPGPGPAALVASGRRAPSTVRDERVHQRDDAGVAEELRLLSGTDPVFLDDPELLGMIMPALRADYRAVETYSCPPTAAVSCPVTVLVGDDDPRTTIDEARAWERHTDGECDLRIFPGGHFFLDDRVPDVANTLSDILLPHYAGGTTGGHLRLAP
ncbi:thioesterase II family protein [Streptomyces sp. NPDC049687]|uniref:thioesterase II family protein n=1 Tax=Streptomyces sp. NPDC049687 TaxID=3365596 RepID=UPI00378A92D3